MSRNHNETKLCIAFTSHCETYFPRQRGVLNWSHLPLEGRSAQEGAKLKAMGVKAGFLDYEFIWLDTFPRLAFLEAKWGKNDYSSSQKEFVSVMQPMGVPCEIFRSVEQGHNILIKHGIKPMRPCQYFDEPNTMTWHQKLSAMHLMNMPPKKDKP